MRRLSLLVLALGLALHAIDLVASTQPLASFVLRDGLLVAGLSAVLFGLYARPLDANWRLASHPRWTTLVISIVALAAFLRGWRVADLPPSCVAHECELALQLAGGTGQPTFFNLLGKVIYDATGQGLTSLRIAGVLVGTLAVLIFILTAVQYAGQAGALLATLLLALDPWHIWSSRSGDPWLLYMLLLTGLLGALAYISRSKYGAWIAGGTALALGVFGLFLTPDRLPQRSAAAIPFLTVLFHGEEPSFSFFGDGQALLGAFHAALLFLGLGYAVRYARQFRNLLLLVCFLATGVWVLGADLTQTPAHSLLLVLSPFFFLFIALAAGALTELAVQTWRPVVQPRWLLVSAMAASLLYAGPDALHLFNQLDMRSLAGPDAVEMAIGRYLADDVQNQTAASTVYFAPAAVLEHPATRLLAGSALDKGTILPLGKEAYSYLLSGESAQNLVFLLPGYASEWLAWLRQIFPGHLLERQGDSEDNKSFFFILYAPAQEVTARQGLGGVLVPASGASITLPPMEQLAIDWSSILTATTSFTARWQGSLLAPTMGVYEFAVEGADAPGASFTMDLDNVTVLNSVQGVITQSASLVKGFHNLTIDYRWDNGALSMALPPQLIVRWRRPDAAWEPIPRQFLHNPPAPDVGLLATYFAGSVVNEGSVLEQRKEPFLGFLPDLAQSYHVHWTGQVAAPRAGEYLLAIQANGSNQLFIDGRLLLDGRATGDSTSVYSEGVIYLTQGWHTIEIFFAPSSETPEFQLHWQPPGSEPGLLGSHYLSPLAAAVNPGALPSPPPLVDPRLGDDRFALAQALDVWQPQVRIPPANLPVLPFELQWRVGGVCDVGSDQLNQPHGVVVDAELGRVFVADTGNLRVAIFHLDGAQDGFIQSDLFQEPFDIEQVPDGALLVLDALAQQIFRVEIESESGSAGAPSWPQPRVELLSLSTSFYRPRGLAVDTAGNLIVADTGGGRIAVLQQDGQDVGQFGGRGSLLERGQPVDALWVDGVLWAVSAEDGRLWRFDTNGSMTVVQPTNTLNGPQLAGLPDGRFFVSDPGRGLVLFHSKNGQPLGQFSAPGVIIAPTGIDVASSGDRLVLAVVDSTVCAVSLWETAPVELPDSG